jgi:polysaccharide biosynthesis/export protein
MIQTRNACASQYLAKVSEKLAMNIGRRTRLNEIFLTAYMQTRSREIDMDDCLETETRIHAAEKLPPESVTCNKSRSSGKDRLWIVGVVAFLTLAVCTGCRTIESETLPEKGGGQMPGVLGVGDVVKISFTGAPELNQAQKIPSDGKFSLPLIGDVYAQGKSLKQLQDELSARYKSQLQNSEVIVSLESIAIPVVISGEVQKPGKIIFERPATVLEAVMEAGGLTPYADLRRVSLIRLVNGQYHTQIFNLNPVLSGRPTAPTYVRAGDVIFVAQRLF